jgi:hypothetical protein
MPDRVDKTKPWPDEVEYYGRRIFELQTELTPILKVVIRQGIERMRYSTVDMFLPDIETIAEDIDDMCMVALGYARPGRGRPEKWVIVTRDIKMHSETILNCVEKIRMFSRQHKWQSCRTCFLVILDKCKEIKELLMTVPINRNDIPIPFREVIAELDDE